MTKPRDPVTVEQALVKIAALVTFEGMAAALTTGDRKVADRTVRDWSDPDVAACIGVDDAIALDLAYRAAGGDGSPLFELYGLRLELAHAAIYATQAELTRRAMAGLKEHSEAAIAQIACTLPGATAADFDLAKRETEESIAAETNTLALLRQGAGPRSGDERVPGVTT